MKRLVHGLPITPKRLLESLAGESFCVSFAYPGQAADAVRLVGSDQVLILDNGAFTVWKQGGRIDRLAFWRWANELQARCPVAVAVIPDVIEGSEHENLIECSYAVREGLAEFPERCMAIWHMNESIAQLERLATLFNFVGIGSCAEYDVQQRRGAYLARMEEVQQALDRVESTRGRRPYVHLMRGLHVLPDLPFADSADSTNVARNHCRLREHGENRTRILADRIAARVASGLEDAQTYPAEYSHNFHHAPAFRLGPRTTHVQEDLFA